MFKKLAVNLAISAIVKLMYKYGEDFDAAKAKIFIRDYLAGITPDFLEDSVFGLVDFIIDKFSAGIGQSSAVVGDVLNALANKDWAGATLLVRKFIIGLFETQMSVEIFAAQGKDAQSQAFFEAVTKAKKESESSQMPE